MASVLKVDTIKSLAGNEAMTISEAGVASFASQPVVPSDIPVIEVTRENVATGATVNVFTEFTTNFATPSILSGGTFSGGRFTPNLPGYYQVNVIVFSSVASGGSLWGSGIFINGAAHRTAYVRTNPSVGTGQQVCCSYIVSCNGSTDTISMGYFVTATPTGLTGQMSVCLLQRTA